MTQIQDWRARPTPKALFKWDAVQHTGVPPGSATNRKAWLTKNTTLTWDSMRGNSVATCQAGIPFATPNERVDFSFYGGWFNIPAAATFRGRLANIDQQYFIQGETFQLEGMLALTSGNLGINKGFYYNGGSAEQTADLMSRIPSTYQKIPILTDADIIIHILEAYNIKPETTNHSIEASSIEVARVDPIYLPSTQSGLSLIQALDAFTHWRTFDGPGGAVYRRQVYGAADGTPIDTLLQGRDILDVQRSLSFRPRNRVKVTGAFNESLADYVFAYTPVNEVDVLDSPWIHDPPGILLHEINSEYIETVPMAQLIADQWYPVVRVPFEEYSVEIPICTDIMPGDLYIVDCHLITGPAYVVAHTMNFGNRRSTLTMRITVTV